MKSHIENSILLLLKNDNLSIGHHCPLDNGRHIVYQGAKRAFRRDLQILFNSSIFRTESYLWISNRGSIVERNISNFLVFGPV